MNFLSACHVNKPHFKLLNDTLEDESEAALWLIVSHFPQIIKRERKAGGGGNQYVRPFLNALN